MTNSARPILTLKCGCQPGEENLCKEALQLAQNVHRAHRESELSGNPEPYNQAKKRLGEHFLQNDPEEE